MDIDQLKQDFPMRTRAKNFLSPLFGRHERLVTNQDHIVLKGPSQAAGRSLLKIYIPNRTVIVLQRIE
jgi:hypothetical protein